MKNYFKYIGIGFALISFIGTIFYLFEQKNKQIRSLKNEVIEKAVLIKESEGMYSKVVNDLAKEKELKQKIESEFQELSKILKERKERPVQIVEQILQMPFRIDTVNVYDTIIQEKSTQIATFYYPDQNDYFASVDVSFQGGIGIGKFNFNPLPVNLVVTQKDNGLYTAYAESHDFIEFSKVDVNTLPMEPQFPDKPYKFYLGGGIGYIEGFKFYTAGSVRWKDHIMDVNVFGFSGITLGYKRPL